MSITIQAKQKMITSTVDTSKKVPKPKKFKARSIDEIVEAINKKFYGEV